MNTINQLDQSLDALRQEHRSIQPPPALEAAILRQAECSSPRRTYTVRNWSLALTTVAALVIAIVLLYPRPSHPTVQTHTTSPQSPQTLPTSQVPQAVSAPSAPTVASTAPHTRQVAKSQPRPTAQHRSSPGPDSGTFVLLPAGVGLPEPVQGILIRTRIDTNSLRSYGFTPPPPGAPQTILAEFLVGEDGLPRAIRLVP